jgi:hypothetical protein
MKPMNQWLYGSTQDTMIGKDFQVEAIKKPPSAAEAKFDAVMDEIMREFAPKQPTPQAPATPDK